MGAIVSWASQLPTASVFVSSGDAHAGDVQVHVQSNGSTGIGSTSIGLVDGAHVAIPEDT
jgi:hypothetical protein